ncbi:orotidine-5'-phosphate decarboxylase [Nocardioides sp. Y6]|uniref:Orotidine 5'-phosphate decarboxylase n=1 Tax=Nocardioides malaquae TaxID=2773426 RepID=A0ABR9RNC9_9ACTN|nr:orotidine-5'-phosphate decarboxylase [Nocardioides malaquae]MBE7323077.1 orotidine-5'-phosphate decarboxylase [Nocardioides malaquae]
MTTTSGSTTSGREPFGARLHRLVAARGRLCVGIDPHASLLQAWGLDDDVAGLERFAMTAVEALAPEVSVIKPQSAFYERFGSRGVAVLERVVAHAREAGALVCMDVKRGDIGSTTQAYADAYLDPASPLFSDSVTASPFLGFGSLSPMVETARKHGSGLFVLALTSNPEGREVQRARTEDGRTVAATILDALRALNVDTDPLGSFGPVIGATVGDPGVDVDVNGPILVPGYGAQGGTVSDMRRVFGDAARALVPSTSRGVLEAGPAGLVDAARRAIDDVAALDA